MATITSLKPENVSKARDDAHKSALFPEDFLWFWSEYPNKKAKLDALKAWKQTAELRPDTEEIIAAISTQKNSNEWMRGYIPYPATWLRDGRWLDE